MPKPQYAQKFRREWLQDPALKDWLTEKKKSSGISVPQCRYCQCVLNLKLSDIKEHGKSKKHLKNAEAMSTARQPPLPFQPVKTSSQTQITEGQIALFVAEHTSVALRKDIGNNHYSLLLDESTDISDTKYLGIAIIYNDEQKEKIVSTFLSLSELQEANAEGIVTTLKKTLDDFGLDLKRMRGIGTDNASVMVGINNGVYEKLRKDVPDLVLIRCVCHSLQLSVSAATVDALPRNLDFLISETYNWFSRSSSRQATYRKMYNIINDNHDPLKIVQACQTRWLSISTAVERIHDQWLELKTHFDVTRHSEKCYTAEMLYSMYSDQQNLAYIKFLVPILKDVRRVNKAFESNDADPTKLLDDLVLLIKSLLRKVILPTSKVDILEGNIESFISPKPYLGYDFEQHMENMHKEGFAPNQELTVRDRCIKFIVKLVKELRQRLPNNVEVLQKMSLLSVENALRVVKNSLIPLMELLQLPPQEIGAVDSQWHNLTLVKWTEVKDTVLFWNEVNKYKDASHTNPFNDLAKFALSVLVIPHSNAKVERIFSQLNIVKNKLRNRMGTTMTNAILGIRAGLKRAGKSCFEYEIPAEVSNMIGTSEVYTRSTEIVLKSDSSPGPSTPSFGADAGLCRWRPTGVFLYQYVTVGELMGDARWKMIYSFEQTKHQTKS
ncbi:uncharacterized protein LOC122268140 [Penaeus japonicus]|uniref:uncharacterized protein LOC122268140 n=1 Tax=Penaeus japonicus TaxID=27405 RepID=UPI001C712A59|nr:uncharacterized protein LOC122268140 [Penaeus japonicus]